MKNLGVYLQRILDAINLLERYTDGVLAEDFEVNQEKIDACLMQLQQIGEVSKQVAKFYPDFNDIPTSEMAKMRDLIAHYYHGISEEEIRNIIKLNIPETKQIIQTYLKNKS